jgi:hypothetical protein
VDMLARRQNRTLYVGVTSDLVRRVAERTQGGGTCGPGSPDELDGPVEPGHDGVEAGHFQARSGHDRLGAHNGSFSVTLADHRAGGGREAEAGSHRPGQIGWRLSQSITRSALSFGGKTG